MPRLLISTRGAYGRIPWYVGVSAGLSGKRGALCTSQKPVPVAP
jgi:hypothetical protein